MRAGAILATLAPLLLGGCLLNDAYELTGVHETVSPKSAIIIVGARDDRFSETQTGVTLRFEHFSLETGRITGNCSHWDRLELASPLAPGQTRYYAFSAPPGPYVLTRSIEDDAGQNSQIAFHAPAGAVTYFGDFWEQGGAAPSWNGKIVRYVDREAAAAYAAARGLPAPEPVKQTPIPDAAMGFVCTP